MIRAIEAQQLDMLAERIVEVQRSAYAVEAKLIGFDGIPQLHETADDVRGRTGLAWVGAFDDDRLVGVIAWDVEGDVIEIDRLAVDPAAARRGFGRALVQAVPRAETVIVSTGEANEPAVRLYLGEGFERVGAVEVEPGLRLAQFRR